MLRFPKKKPRPSRILPQPTKLRQKIPTRVGNMLRFPKKKALPKVLMEIRRKATGNGSMKKFPKMTATQPKRHNRRTAPQQFRQARTLKAMRPRIGNGTMKKFPKTKELLPQMPVLPFKPKVRMKAGNMSKFPKTRPAPTKTGSMSRFRKKKPRPETATVSGNMLKFPRVKKHIRPKAAKEATGNGNMKKFPKMTAAQPNSRSKQKVRKQLRQTIPIAPKQLCKHRRKPKRPH